MAYEQRDNSGTIFVNNRKEKDTHPDRTGTAMIDGVEYYINGWLKEGKNGAFLSVSFKKKEGDGARRSPPRPAQNDGGTMHNDMNDDVPFGPEFR